MTLSYKPFQICLTALGASSLLTSCAVGPNFKKPEAPPISSYTPSPVETTASTTNVVGGEAQHFDTGKDIAGDWWTLFHSKPLNDLIERSLKANPNLKAAQASLVMARENALAQKGAYYPQATASFSGSRQGTSTQIAPVPNTTSFYDFDLWTPQVTVSYVPDVFGLNRRTVESLNAQEQQARFALVAADIALSANVVSAAVQEASLVEQIAATHHLIDLNTDMLRILRIQFTNGYADRLDVAAQESQLAQIIATLPPLVKQLDQVRDLLAALDGGFPSEGPAEKFELFSDLQLPRDLPLSLPSKLVKQRPDVLQAEENMHAASAQVGIATANRLPNFMLSADFGSTALALGQVLSSGTGFWAIGGTVAQPLFQGGSLLHRQRAAWAGYTNAAEMYRSTVITAFQNVADTLTALKQDAAGLNAAAAARDSAKVTLDLSRQQYETGYANYLALLSAETAYDTAVINLVQAQANRYSDTAALFLALGGGWWNRADYAARK
jgi:NodT family efflux transporter outer membrane factor (OMF) lipoprotein